MSNMFSGCYKLTKIDLSLFDTKNVNEADNIYRTHKYQLELILSEKLIKI